MHILDRSKAAGALRRLNALEPLDEAARAAIEAAVAKARTISAHQEFLREGERIPHPLLILEGWAARIRLFSDGRRQILSLLLPGELIGLCRNSEPRAASTIVALNELTLCVAPDPAASPSLCEAYARSTALDEAHLLAQIARLGRLSAHERISDLFLELQERMQGAGLMDGGGFHLPLTQEMLADLLGMTPVHINRMLQQARQAGELSLRSGRLVLNDPKSLARTIGGSHT